MEKHDNQKPKIQNVTIKNWAHSKRARNCHWHIRFKNFLLRKLSSKAHFGGSGYLKRCFEMYEKRNRGVFPEGSKKYLRAQVGLKIQNPLILADQRVSPPERVGRKRSHTQLTILSDAGKPSMKLGLFLSYLLEINKKQQIQ